jgi:hypothetical protein
MIGPVAGASLPLWSSASRCRLLATLLTLDVAGWLAFPALQRQHADKLGVPRSTVDVVALGKAFGVIALVFGTDRRVLRRLAAAATAGHGIWAARLMLRHDEAPVAAYQLAQSVLAVSLLR